MDAMDGSRRLISFTHTGGMEEDYGQNTLVQFLRQEHRHIRRLSQFLAVVILLLISAVLALTTAVVLGTRIHSPDCKPMMQPFSHLSGDTEEPRHCTNFTTPSAMLTAPAGSITKGKYLDWESNDGNAHCCGGFSYSSGRLVVPRQGMYRVFLQITFKGGLESCGSVGELKLTNIVYLSRVKYPKDVAILSSVDTVTCSLRSWSKSLYTSGLFILEDNSMLAVTSSSPELITRKEEEVFFGVEFVSR